MTSLSQQCEIIRGWLNVGSDVYSDSVITQWIRMTESILSKELRCKEMIQIDTGSIVEQRYLLPADWRELNFVRVIDGKVLRYLPRDDFYNPDFSTDQKNCYSIAGDYVLVGANTPEGTQLEVTYYQNIPPLEEAVTSWLPDRYPMLFTLKTLYVGSVYSFEDERGDMWKTRSDELIASVNYDHAVGRASGSRLTRRHRGGFG
jgi:hypothetical protein